MSNETIVVNIDDFNQEHINELSRRAFSSQAGLAAVSAGPWPARTTIPTKVFELSKELGQAIRHELGKETPRLTDVIVNLATALRDAICTCDVDSNCGGHTDQENGNPRG